VPNRSEKRRRAAERRRVIEAARSSTQAQTPEQSPKEPLRLPIPRWIEDRATGGGIAGSLFRLIRVVLSAIWWSGRVLWLAPSFAWRSLRIAGKWIREKDYYVNLGFRIATAVSVGYLVYDRLYETSAVVNVSASDPKSPFLFPFTITNISHLFEIHNLRWSCDFYDMTGSISNLEMTAAHGTQTKIRPGQTINVSCGMNQFPNAIFETGTVRITISYTAEIFGIYSWGRVPEPARFTWVGSASNPQWIRGDFANETRPR
jgi:hypothetical protein